MDRQMDGYIDRIRWDKIRYDKIGWIGRWMDGWMDRQIDRFILSPGACWLCLSMGKSWEGHGKII